MGVAERREREREERRVQITDAAERVIRERGAVDATMADVAAEAELSKGTLYLYFKSKDELYLAIATRSLAALVQRFEALDDPAATGLQLLDRVMAAQRAVVRAYPMRFQAVLAWIVSGFHADTDAPAYGAYRALHSQVFEAVGGLIARGQADGSIRAELDPQRTGMQMWGGMLGIWALYFSQSELARRLPGPVDFDAMVDSYGQTFLRGIAAAPETC